MKFTYYTIIGKNPMMIKNHLYNIKSNAGFDNLECEKELIVIVYKNKNIKEETTNDILKICKEYGARTEIYNEPTEDFLTNLYDCWNLGYEYADDGFVFRGGSDQVFNKDSFINLYNIAIREYKINPKTIFQAQTIENIKTGIPSRHFLKDFGGDFENLNGKDFEDFCIEINKGVKKDVLNIKECLSTWGYPKNFKDVFPRLGNIERTDGCSWLMTKEDWIKYGPMPRKEGRKTGDVVIHDRLSASGYRDLLVRDCITYHFMRGESSKR